MYKKGKTNLNVNNLIKGKIFKKKINKKKKKINC